MKIPRFLLIFAEILSAILILGQIFSYPSAVREVLSGSFVPGFGLVYPKWTVLLAPFFQTADHLTILSINQHIALLVFLNAFYLLWRCTIWIGPGFRPSKLIGEMVRIFLLNFFYAVFLAVVILLPRPMARLEVENPDSSLLIFDAHSHTSHSWDGRKSFTPRKNLEWHGNAGFMAAFITDHNTISGRKEALSGVSSIGVFPLSGEEVSLKECHLAILGNRALISNGPYDGSVQGIENFLTVMRDSSALVIASLPEYWLYHWDKREDFVRWGVRGFEIINSAPAALDFPPSKRAATIELCRKNNLIMTGITDNHGWGSTAYVWNVAHIPELSRLRWLEIHGRFPSPGPIGNNLEKELLLHLKKEGSRAVQIFTRVKAEPRDNKIWLCVDPLLQIWEMARTLPFSHLLSFLFWIWVPVGIYWKRAARIDYD